jgi:hypothetical protein
MIKRCEISNLCMKPYIILILLLLASCSVPVDTGTTVAPEEQNNNPPPQETEAAVQQQSYCPACSGPADWYVCGGYNPKMKPENVAFEVDTAPCSSGWLFSEDGKYWKDGPTVSHCIPGNEGCKSSTDWSENCDSSYPNACYCFVMNRCFE